MTRSPAALRALVIDEARRLGFQLVGIAAAGGAPHLAGVDSWLDRGYGGEMHYLARRAPAPDAAVSGSAGVVATVPDEAPPHAERRPYLREDVRHAFPWAQSVVCCGLLYNTAGPRSLDPVPTGRGWISRYAWGDDYHQVVLKRMRRLAQALQPAESAPANARVYVDTGPIVERAYAEAAGLGWIGKNTCLIHERVGSYFFLGTLICSEPIEPDARLPDRCGSCDRCVQACPTGALRPYEMDATRCIAYLTIELRGAIPADLRSGVGRQVFGCDICQDVCPWNWNRRAPVSLEDRFQPRPERVNPDLAELASLSEEEFRAWCKGSAVKRVKYPAWLRNIAVAMGNSGNPHFRPMLERLATDANPLVREHALWALGQIAGSAPGPAPCAETAISKISSERR